MVECNQISRAYKCDEAHKSNRGSREHHYEKPSLLTASGLRFGEPDPDLTGNTSLLLY